MKHTLLVVLTSALLAGSVASCADTATCFEGEVLVDGLCLPAPPQATGGASVASGGTAGSSQAGAAGEGGAS